jgi:hypothetical protein
MSTPLTVRDLAVDLDVGQLDPAHHDAVEELLHACAGQVDEPELAAGQIHALEAAPVRSARSNLAGRFPSAPTMKALLALAGPAARRPRPARGPYRTEPPLAAAPRSCL